MTMPSWILQPENPRAPSREEWARMSQAERETVIRMLPEQPPEAAPPEGDQHRKTSHRALDALDNYFRTQRRSVYLSSNLAVYYPDESHLAPDLFAVLDVSPHDRMKWVVSAEGKGLDFYLEVLVRGDRAKDLRHNVERYARLGIREYFVLDVPKARIIGYRLAPEGPVYQAIVPQRGRWRSEVLELELTLEGSNVRFYAGSALLLETAELADKATQLLADAVLLREQETQRADSETQRADSEAQRADSEAQRADAETQRADELERQLAAARAEIERLRRTQ